MTIAFDKIVITNFLSVGSEPVTLDYTQGVNTIRGKNYDENESNGAGKTAILCDALLWCLFGSMMRKLKLASIVNDSVKKGTEVSVYFTKNGKKYRVTRAIPTTLEVFEDDVPANLSITDETQARINTILEADYDIYRNLVVFNINKTKPFASDSTDNKRKMWEYVLNFSVYRDMLEIIKKSKGLMDTDLMIKAERSQNCENEVTNSKIREASAEKTVAQYQNSQKEREQELITAKNACDGQKLVKQTSYELARTEIDKQKIKREEELNTSLKNFTLKQTSRLFDLTKSVTTFGEQKKMEATTELENMKKYEKDLNTLTEIEKILPEFEKKLLNAKSEYETKNKADKENYGAVSTIKTKISLKEDEASNIKILPAKCPTCRQEVPDSYKTKFTEMINNDVAGLKLQLEEIVKATADSNKEVVELYTKYSELNTKMNSIRQKMAVKPSLEAQLAKAKQIIANVDVEIVKKQSEFDSMKGVIEADIEQQKRDTDKSIKDMIRDNDLRKAEYQRMIDSLGSETDIRKMEYQTMIDRLSIDTGLTKLEEARKACISERLTKETELEAITGELVRIREYVDNYDYCKTVLSDDGIKKFIIGLILPFANQRLNKYMTQMQTSYVVEFDEMLKEKYVKTSGRGKERDYENFSEGEKKRIDMAMLLTFIDIGQMCGTLNTNLLIFDELLDTSVDDSGTDAFMEILYNKSEKDGLSTWIISHKETIAGIPHNREVIIGRKNETSFVEKT